MKSDATIDTYLDKVHGEDLLHLDGDDSAIVSAVAQVERTSDQLILYHACSVYIVFLAWLYDSLRSDAPMRFDLQETAEGSYALVNLTWRVYEGASRLPMLSEPKALAANWTEDSFSSTSLDSFLHRAQELGAISKNFDHTPGVRERLMAVNINLFGGSTMGEKTWDYRVVSSVWSPMGVSGSVSFLEDIFSAFKTSAQVREQVKKMLDALGCLLSSVGAVRAFPCSTEALDTFTTKTAADARALLASPPRTNCSKWVLDIEGTKCATGMLVQVLLEPSLSAKFAYISKAYGIPAQEDFVSGYHNVKNTQMGDDQQARVFLSRDLFDEKTQAGVRPVQFALHHWMFLHTTLMSVFLDMANEIRLLLGTAVSSA